MKVSKQELASLPRLYDGPNFTIYRLDKNEFGRPVIIKLLKSDTPTPRQQARLANEYELTKDLTIPGVRQAREKITIEGRPALILDYVEGKDLKQAFVEQRRSLAETLSAAISIAQVLGDIHHHDIIHKNISSSSILIDLQNQAVTIIGFEIASYSYVKTRQADSIDLLADTLPYISPEQTGRTNRFIDYRTDFYSLGVTLYEMFTGQLPFTTTDPAELIYHHIARQPRPVSEVNPDIPPAVSDIVQKLLAKSPEDRYQSAYGLKADLENCLTRFRATGAIERFELGQEDFSGRLQVPQKLYGRDDECQTLKQTFEYVRKGSREIVLVSGNPGVGKSVLVDEIRPLVVDKGGYFAAGKCDQYQQNTPYYGLSQAFTGLVSQMLTQSEEQLARCKAEILQAVGDNGQLLVEVIPNLELIIGRQTSMPDLGPTKAQHRFQQVFQNFVRAIARKEHPLVLFLDNLQWVDVASLNLIRLLMTGAENQYLLFIGAFRDNEVLAAHPLMTTVKEMQQDKSVVINEIRLGNLPDETLNLLIADMLQSETAYAQPLTNLVYEKSGGNPFFAVEFLTSLPEERALFFNFAAKKWQWDEVRIRAKDIPANMAAFITHKIQKLPDNTRQTLALAACIGHIFDLKTLLAIADQPAETIFEEIRNGVKEGFVLPPDDYEVLLSLEVEQIAASESRFEFVDDRIRQAFYSLISKKQRRLVLLTIGRLRLQEIKESELEEHIFDIADRLNEGFQYLKDEEEIIRLAEINLIAGRKAKKATAYKTAIWYLSMGIGMLPPRQKWTRYYDLTINLYADAAEAEYLNSTFERAEQLATEALQFVTDNLEKIRFYQFLILLATAQNRNSVAIKAGLEALELLDIFLPTRPEPIKAYIEKAQQVLSGKIGQIEQLAELPEMHEPYQLAAMRILMDMTAPAHQVDPALLPVIILTMVMISVQYGNSPLAAFAYGRYAALLSGTYGNFEQGYQFGQLSLKLLEQFGATELETKVSFLVNAMVRPWQEHTRETVEPLRQGYRLGLETGDLEYAYYGAIHRVGYLFCTGSELDQVRQIQARYIEATDKLRLEFHSSFGKIWAQTVSNLMGKAEAPYRLKGELFDEAEMLPLWIEQKNVILTFGVFCCKTMLLYLFRKYAEAIDAARLAEEYGQGGEGFIYLPVYNFYYALALLAHYPQVDAKTQQSYLDELASIQEKMKQWADHAPLNFQHKYDLIEAEQARVSGETARAIEYYGRAVQAAREQGYIQEEALAYEREAEFYLALGQEDLAQFCLIKARDNYHSWGATRKADDLEQQYPHLFAFVTARPFQAGRREATEVGPLAAEPGPISLDTAAILKVSHTLAEEVRLDQLLDKVIRIVMENAGAEKGIFIENKDNSLLIQAKGEIGQDLVETMQAVPIEDSSDIPISIVNYVGRTQKSIMLNDAIHDPTYATDRYIAVYRPKSLLCLPIVHKGKLSGLLYLENNLTTNAFTQDRLELLQTLSAQAAISMENAQLYTNLENKITDLKRAEEALALRVLYQERLSACSQTLLADAEDSFVEGLRHLLNAATASRVYVFENFEDPQDGLCSRQTHEVCAPGVTSQLHNPVLQHLPVQAGFGDWAEILASGKPVGGLVEEVPPAVRPILESQGILSILLVPIWVAGGWYGFIGFDHTTEWRRWGEQDIHLLQTAAGIIANYIERKRAEAVSVEAEKAQAVAATEAEKAQAVASAEAEKATALNTLNTVSQQLTGILDLAELFQQIVTLTKETFNYYHVHIYLVNETRDSLVLTEGYGQAGIEMKQRGHRIPFQAPQSLVARAAREKQIVTVDNVREEPSWLPNPLLPDTYSEMAVPVLLEEQAVGVLDVQQDKISGLDDSDAELLHSLANQVAVAIRNAQYVTEVQTALAEAHAAQARYLERAWQGRAARIQDHCVYTPAGIPPVSEAYCAEAKRQAFQQQQPVLLTGIDGISHSIIAPVSLAGKNIGALQLHQSPDREQEAPWTEEDLAIIQAVLDQVAQTAENLRLFEETRERAGREQMIREITDKLRAAPNLERLLQTAARELGQHLAVPHTVLELGIEAGEFQNGEN